MIKITVNLFASFRDGRFKQEQQEVPAGITLRLAIADIGIAEKEIGMALVNGRHAPMEQALSDGDMLYLSPWIGGG
jgi:sulfur-carrier protein